jgi:hypothetical protein
MNAMHSTTLATATLNLVDAESDYEVARQELHAAQRAAVLSGGSTQASALALDEAVLTYRAARMALADARAAWRGAYGGIEVAADAAPPAAAGEEAAARGEPAEVRFARWLLEAAGQDAPALAA